MRSVLDWKVVLFAVLACYLLPWLLVGTFATPLLSREGPTEGWRALSSAALGLIYFVAAPIGAGYFTARYAKNRPQMHVLAVVGCGWLLSLALVSATFSHRLLYLVASLALASLGAFPVLRRKARDA